MNGRVGLSVVTLVKNRAAHLAQLVEGLRRGTMPPAELVIVDMSDTPVEVSSTAFPVQMIRMASPGLPLAAARNAGARQAGGERLLFLDVDCIPHSGILARMDAALQADDALICAEVLYLAADEARGDWREAVLLATAMPHPARRFPAAGWRVESNPGLFWSTIFGIRRDRFFSLGGFDESYTGYGAEDTDFGVRAAAAQVPLHFLGGPGAFHQHHGVTTPPLQHFADIIANARHFHAKWGDWPMTGWLESFQTLGLVTFDGTTLQVIRFPTAAEITAAQCPIHRF